MSGLETKGAQLIVSATNVTIIKSTAYCQETKNSEWVEWCYGEQWEFLLSVSEAVEVLPALCAWLHTT